MPVTEPLNFNQPDNELSQIAVQQRSKLFPKNDYKDTNKYTTVRTLGGWEGNGTGYVYFASGLWMNTAAVSTLYFQLPYSTNFGSGTTFAIYGIKTAGA